MRARVGWWQRAALLALTATIAACSTRPPPAPPPRVAPPPPPRPVIVPPPKPLPTAAPRNRVAILVPTTGASANVGRSIANAAAMALADMKGAGISLSTYDTAGPGGARVAAEQALAGGARLVLGPLLAADVREAAPVLRSGGVPVLSFSNDAGVAGGGVFVLGFQPAQSVARVVAFARARGVESFAALIPAGTYGQRASTAFVRAVQASGGRVTGIASYTRDRRQIVAAARKVADYDGRIARAGGAKAALRPDGTVAPVAARLAPLPFSALLIADGGTTAAAFGPALAQYGVRAGSVRMLGTELWATEPALARSKALAGAWYAAVPERRFEQLARRYAAIHGGRPSRLASLGYDAVLLALAAAPDWRVGEPFPAARLTDRGGYSGIDGAFRLGAGGVAERAMEVRQLGGGGAVVSPAAASFGG